MLARTDEAPRVIAEVRDYEDLLLALRARAEEINASREEIDRITGWADGYCAKLLSDPRSSF